MASKHTVEENSEFMKFALGNRILRAIFEKERRKFNIVFGSFFAVVLLFIWFLTH